MSAAPEQGIDISKLSLDQILQLKDSTESEIKQLKTTISITNDTISRTQRAKEALQTFATSPAGTDVLVPLTDSMYINGKTVEGKRPIIELGTGYFAETSVENADAFFNRRIARLTEQSKKLQTAFRSKTNDYRLIVQIANQKLAQRGVPPAAQ